jgi:hypothetical protein
LYLHHEQHLYLYTEYDGKKMNTEFQSIDFSQNSGQGPRSGFAKWGGWGGYVAEKTKFLWVDFSSYFKEHVLLLRGYYITEAFYYHDDLSVKLSALENLV